MNQHTGPLTMGGSPSGTCLAALPAIMAATAVVPVFVPNLGQAPSPSAEHVESARAAGLRYVTDRMPGIRRRKAGKGFAYIDPQGKWIRDASTLKRIRALVIPPAWTDVWICPDPNGHIQVTGRDA